MVWDTSTQNTMEVFLLGNKKIPSRKKSKKEGVEQYTHDEIKRPNNPPVGLVDPRTDPEHPGKKYKHDPRLDPQLQWSGKNENAEFKVDTVSLHVHERIDPHTILEKVLKRDLHKQQTISNFFDSDENNLPIRDAIDFYKHEQNWSNRLIAGDSLLVMNSLLEKEGMEGKVQMIYIDPPYGIKYGSNFQPFVNKKDVKDGKDEDLTQEPEMIKAFRDTWELGIHSYLSYLRDRLLLAKKLLTESGSVFVQISEENLHHVREILDEVFNSKNFVSQITIKRASVMFEKKYLNNACFYVVWYAKNITTLKYHDLFENRDVEWFVENAGSHLWIENIHECKRPTSEEKKDLRSFLNKNTSFKLFSTLSIYAQGIEKRNPLIFHDQKYYPPTGSQWKTSYQGLENLKNAKRLILEGNAVRYKQYLSDYPVKTLNSLWIGIGSASNKIYVVQSSVEIVKRCVLMSTDPGDLVFDPTCGSGTTAHVAEKFGRRWITCDTSRVAITLAKQRLMTSYFDYYKLQHPNEGISSGFEYETVPHITLGSIANNEEPPTETLYDKPKLDKTKTRISGPFTVEAVPAPTVKSIDELSKSYKPKNNQNLGKSLQQQWRDELLKTGIRGKSGQKIEFSRVETHPATRWIHADAETMEKNPKRVIISFGPEHAPLEQRQVELAIEEAREQALKPAMIIFAAMQFDPEAAKDIDELNWPGITILKTEMNKDLLTKDLKKKRTTNESFWLMGQPDVDLKKNGKKYTITVNGFDYYNITNNKIESGGSSKIAMWMLDTDYDGRSMYPQQMFFPMSGGVGWEKLSKTLRSQIDDTLIEKYSGTKSIPFESGPNKRAAVKIVDDRGIESLKIVEL